MDMKLFMLGIVFIILFAAQAQSLKDSDAHILQQERDNRTSNVTITRSGDCKEGINQTQCRTSAGICLQVLKSQIIMMIT